MYEFVVGSSGLELVPVREFSVESVGLVVGFYLLMVVLFVSGRRVMRLVETNDGEILVMIVFGLIGGGVWAGCGSVWGVEMNGMILTAGLMVVGVVFIVWLVLSIIYAYFVVFRVVVWESLVVDEGD